MAHETGGRWEPGCDGCDPESARCCSPLTRAAVADLVDLRPGAFVLVLGVPELERIARAARAVGASGRILVVPGCGEPHLAPLAGPNVQLVGGTFDRIQLPPSIADVVTSCCTLHRVCNTRGAFGEIHRILKIGGRLLVSDLIAERSVFEATASDEVPRACRNPPRAAEPEYLAAVREAGFRDAAILQRTAAYDLGGVLVSSMVLTATRSPRS